MIIQGANNPIVVKFDSNISTLPALLITLWHDSPCDNAPVKQWTLSDMTVDGTTFYQASVIPIGVQLIDYTACLSNTAINSSGQAVTQEWYYASDFTPIETGMSFSYRAGIWFYMGFYDANQDVIATIYVYNYATQDPNDTNTGYGNISGANIPANAKYLRMSGTAADSSHMSLIRTA